jgi:polyisoprenyl-phosphate glycosyltransferase
MLRFAVDGITSFSTVPLRMAIWFGILAGLVAMGGGVWALWEKLYGTGVVKGWTTIMILVGLGSSAQLLMTGILGEYVGRIYEEVKRRPLYVVEREIDLPPPGAPDEAGRGVS